MKYITLKITLINIIIFKYSHPISLQHIIFIHTFLYDFKLKLIFKSICLWIISTILWSSIYELKSQSLCKSILTIFHIINLYFITNFSHPYSLNLLICNFMPNCSIMLFTNYTMKCLI